MALGGELVAHGERGELRPADFGYPERLHTISDPPPVLYFDGRPVPEDRQAVAIVGARHATGYGLRVTDALARELAGLGFTVVSGMARGIDAAAHRGALAVGGRTIAVLGCGLDVIYPPEHARLQAEIAEAGSVITEFPPGSRPLAAHFPRRNRIISGLSLGVVVVEATPESGSLITARLALDQGREVFAVPGPIGPMSRGPHSLIKQGAKLVESVDDILEELTSQFEPSLAGVRRCEALREGARPGALGAGGCDGEQRLEPAVKRSLSEVLPAFNLDELLPHERIVYAHMNGEPMTMDDLTEKTSLASAVVAAALLGLELKDAIRQLPGQRYYRVR